jgi:peptide/nickel transport system substrate-binding protein
VKASLFVTALLIGCLAVFLQANAKTLRWSSQGDFQTMDPHAINETLNINGADLMYEALVAWDKNMKIEPGLALSWESINATTIRFNLRPNVKFHDGTPFTADDVVFTVERVLAPTSNLKGTLEGVVRAVKVDDLTVDFLTNGPAPVLVSQLNAVRIMSKQWAEKHRAQKPQDLKNREETFAARNANGTGPYMLQTRAPDVRTVFVANPNWWGKRESNIDEIVYLPIKSDSTRVAALLSGEVDFVLDPPVQDIPRLKQDPRVKIVEGNEIRTLFLGMDQWRDELLYSNVKGKNPFKDVRVRRAFYHAIDADAIKAQVMRGLAVVAGSIIAPQVHGYTKEADKRLPVNIVEAKRLLVEAGYPAGFEVTLDCPNDRYINDEKICVAIAGMLAKIGVTLKVNAKTKVQYFANIQKLDTSFYLVGWAPTTVDSLNTLQTQVHTPGAGADGEWNYGKYSNPRVDAVIDRLKTETDMKRRVDLTAEALALHGADVGHIPLHHQVIPWAMRPNVNVIHMPNNFLRVKWATIN